MPSLGDFLAIQHQQQLEMGNSPGLWEDKRQLQTSICTYLVGEIYEYLNAINYKHFLPPHPEHSSQRKIELIDTFKYLLTLFDFEGMTEDEIWHLFQEKTAVVRERHKKTVMHERVCGFDIDGVLASYQDWVDEEAFVESGRALALEPVQGASELLSHLKEEGWHIVLITARKRHRYPRIEGDTYKWLEQHGFVYDKVLFGFDKADTMVRNGLRMVFFVEDSPKHALDMAGAVERVYLVSRDIDTHISHPKVINISSIAEIGVKELVLQYT